MDQIIISHLSKFYGENKVFSDFSAVFERGKTTCIMAPSGAGKTTLLRILTGLETADAGRIEGMDGLKKSMVFQEDRLCENLSVSANIRLVRQKKTWGRDQKKKKGNSRSAGIGRTCRKRGSTGPGIVRRNEAKGSAVTRTLQ